LATIKWKKIAIFREKTNGQKICYLGEKENTRAQAKTIRVGEGGEKKGKKLTLGEM